MTYPKKDLQELRAALLGWFDRQKRQLPWRQTSDPYAIWISEIMLQQTRVETVIPYYERFLLRFPGVTELAQADLEEVLSLWSGLGYYRRARLLHRAAQQIVEKHEGRFPQKWKEALALPGIGRYTAGAILSIAYGEEQPVVDGNVQRVLSRLFLLEDPVGSKELDRACWSIAQEWVQGERPGDLNQALMELGALLCVPQKPACLLCPLRQGCSAAAYARPEEYPRPRAQTKQTPLTVCWALVRRRGRLLLLQRPDEGLFAGLWELPGLYLDGEEPPQAQLLTRYLAQIGLTATLSSQPPERYTHLLTHRRLLIHLFRCREVSGRINLSRPTWHWLTLQEIETMPLSAITRKILFP